MRNVLTRLPAYSLDSLRFTNKTASRIDERVGISESNKDASLAASDMKSCAGIIVSDHSQTAGHSFQRYIAKSLGFAGEEKNVAGSIVFGKLLAGLHPRENQFGMFSLQDATQRSVADDDEFNPVAQPSHRAVRFNRKS